MHRRRFGDPRRTIDSDPVGNRQEAWLEVGRRRDRPCAGRGYAQPALPGALVSRGKVAGDLADRAALAYRPRDAVAFQPRGRANNDPAASAWPPCEPGALARTPRRGALACCSAAADFLSATSPCVEGTIVRETVGRARPDVAKSFTRVATPRLGDDQPHRRRARTQSVGFAARRCGLAR